MEDKYYEFMDKLNKSVPVYKIIDPIDKIVPSFVLLIILLLLLLSGGTYLAYTLVSGPSNIATFSVVDNSGNPLSEVPVRIGFEQGDEEIFTSDPLGHACRVPDARGS